MDCDEASEKPKQVAEASNPTTDNNKDGVSASDGSKAAQPDVAASKKRSSGKKPSPSQCEVDERETPSQRKTRSSKVGLNRGADKNPSLSNKKAKKSAQASSVVPRTPGGRKRKASKSVSKSSSRRKKQKAGSSKKSPKNTKTYKLEVPSFAQVQPVLKKGGYTFTLNSRYCRPVDDIESAVEGRHYFSREDLFRQHLCAYGVTCRCGSTDDEETACDCWDTDEKWLIKEWVRYSVIGEAPRTSTEVVLIEQRDALNLLYRVGFKYSKPFGGYAFPGVTKPEDGVTGFLVEKDLWNHLCRHGFPDNCDFEGMPADERLSLELFVASNKGVSTL